MSTHNIQFHDKIRKFSLIFGFWSYQKNFIGTQKQIRISHGKRAICVRSIEFHCISEIDFIIIIIIIIIIICMALIVRSKINPYGTKKKLHLKMSSIYVVC